MANTGNITHTLKAGSDEALYLTPIVSGKIDVGTNFADVIKARMTGESIQGSIETLESNELKSGRYASKKKLGNESAEGSLDFEFSPNTFDALLESAFRDSFKSWSSDDEDNTGYIKSQWQDGKYHDYVEGGTSKPLFGTDGLLKGLTASDYTVKSLNIGSTQKLFDVLRKLGGEDGEDLWQRYLNMEVNTFDINVATNSIVTGSFGFMGVNSPKRLDDSAIKSDSDIGYNSATFDTSKCADADAFFTGLADVKSTTDDQFVSTCGNLWINGQNITHSENITISLNNNIERKNAIMVKKAIATRAGKLDITGNYQAYVVKAVSGGYEGSEPVYNAAVANDTVEIMFLLQDKETDPKNMYLFQIYRASFDAPSSSNNGTDVYEDNMSYTSFDDEAVRILKITKN